jgi:hypothetical protein
MAHGRTNTYLDKLGATREANPPWWWEDEPAQLAMSPDMLNDPAFSQYDFSNLRTFEQDPRLRDVQTLGDEAGIRSIKGEQRSASGYTYVPEKSPYDPNKVYIRGLEEFKPAVGPLAEQEKQGGINQEIASTIAHEFRHTMFDEPKYQGIIQAAYDKFGGDIDYHTVNEMINRAAETQLIPGHWLGETLEDFQENYNWGVTREGRPEHLTQTDTTGQFNLAATLFFDKVRKEKIKQQQTQNWQKVKQAELLENQRSEGAAQPSLRSQVQANRANRTGGWQSGMAADEGFMSGSGTAAEMGSFARGGILGAF